MFPAKSRFRFPRVSPVKLGIAFVIVSVLAGVCLFQKNRIITFLQPGTTIPIEFSQDYRLEEFVSKAKVAGVSVGTVSSVERQPNGSTEVQVKVSNDVRQKIGTLPSAEIRPTTLLGGNYYVDIKPGGSPGEFNGTIPLSRTKLPVELGQVSAALQPDARRGLPSSISNLDGTLSNDGSAALKDLMKDAPSTLGPATGVFNGLRGTHPQTDLPNLVHGLEQTSQTLSQQQGQLADIAGNLAVTSTVLDHRSSDIAAALSGMPETLQSTDAGLDHLHTTIGKLRDTAGPVRPAVRELNSVLGDVDPVLAKAKPVVSDLRDVLVEARPLVGDLTPASRQLTSVLNNVRGPVLDRVNGPILHTVNGPYQGASTYSGTGSNRPLYQELAFMIANADRASMTTDKNGSMIAFLAGAGPGSVAGLPISLEQMFHQLAAQQEGGR